MAPSRGMSPVGPQCLIPIATAMPRVMYVTLAALCWELDACNPSGPDELYMSKKIMQSFPQWLRWWLVVCTGPSHHLDHCAFLSIRPYQSHSVLLRTNFSESYLNIYYVLVKKMNLKMPSVKYWSFWWSLIWTKFGKCINTKWPPFSDDIFKLYWKLIQDILSLSHGNY